MNRNKATKAKKLFTYKVRQFCIINFDFGYIPDNSIGMIFWPTRLHEENTVINCGKELHL